MISALGLRISRVFHRTAPDPFVLVVLLSLLAVVLALAVGDFRGEPDLTLARKATILLDAWRGDEGLWKFLAFGMQMCLVLLTGHALASTRPVRAMIRWVTERPQSAAGAVAMVGLAACATALVNWGLGLVVGALLARDVGRAMAERGRPAHYPLLAAAGYMGLLIWHGGLSGSAPLSMTTMQQAQRVLPMDVVARGGEAILVGLDRTTFSAMNAFVTLGLLVIIPVMLYLLAPKRAEDMLPADRFAPRGGRAMDDAAEDDDDEHGAIPDLLDRTPVLAWAIAAPLILGIGRYVHLRGWASLSLTEIIAAMLALGLVLHGSLRSYAAAVEEGARDCAGIVVQFPLYGGILAVMSASGLAEQFAHWMAGLATERTLPLMTFLAASVLNMFITSGGGLWGVQGPVALESGMALGVDPARMVMAVAYGDQLTNMLQPFWALPLLAITGVKARDIVGYTAVVMVAAGVWIGIGLVLF